MGKEKQIRKNRARGKSENSQSNRSNPTNNPTETAQNPYPDHAHTPSFDESVWSYCTEEQLEDALFTKLDFSYNQVISELVALGYNEDIALKAVLMNGHCYGESDVTSNIFQNSLSFLNSECSAEGRDDGDSLPTFPNLRELARCSIATMVYVIKERRRHYSREDALRWLVMSDLNVYQARVKEVCVPPSGSIDQSSISSQVEVEDVNDQLGATSPLCKSHGDSGFWNGENFEYEAASQKEIESPESFSVTPLMDSNVASYKQLQMQSQARASSLSSEDPPPAALPEIEVSYDQKEGSTTKNEDMLYSLLSELVGLNLLDETVEDVSEEKKDEVILRLSQQVEDLEKKVKERKEWAQQKAIQAARKLSNDLIELKMLRIEREETQWLKKGKQTLDDATTKRLTEVEHALRNASGQVDKANAVVRKLETENAEIKAETAASNLSASESAMTSLEMAKKEKKYLKKLSAWEKQKAKLQEEIAAERERVLEKQQELVEIELAEKEAEVNWRQEQKAKELVLSQLQEEQRLKEAAVADNNRKIETLRLNVEIDSQRYNDDIQRLEQELSQLKSNYSRNSASVVHCDMANSLGDPLDGLLDELHIGGTASGKEVSVERECLICMKDEVSVVFLPCAHQVLCSSCNDKYVKEGITACPSCHVPIEQSIRIYGASL